MKQNIVTNSKVQLKAYSKQDLMELYEVSWKVIKVWLKPNETEIGKAILGTLFQTIFIVLSWYFRPTDRA